MSTDIATAVNLLEIEHLQVQLQSARGCVQAVRDVSLSLRTGEMLALVGESGCGKSVTAQAIMGLQPSSAKIKSSRANFQQNTLFSRELSSTVNRGMAMVFQNPMSTFNPTLSIGYQIAEPLRVHRGFSRQDAAIETERLLSRMKIENAAERARQYPHEFSGGMLQRAAIAMAMAMQPQLLIADEPTTALDVSTQAEVMALLNECREEQQLAVLFITHDLALVSQYADRVAVMYAGEIVETATTREVLHTPAHPYTRALIASLPAGTHGKRLQAIAGMPPDLHQPPDACAFAPRCFCCMKICSQQPAPVFPAHQSARCWLYHPDKPAGSVA